jgi:hypothetical protein
MKRILLALVLPFLLVACWPPDVVVDDGDVVFPPPPVVESDLLEGNWVGAIYFSFTDASGNVEDQMVVVNLNLLPQTPEGTVTGVWEFDTDDEACSASGRQSLQDVTVIVFCDGITALSVSGTVSEGVFSGNYSITNTSEVGIPAGTFNFSSLGGE